jgi:hypothetical protein
MKRGKRDRQDQKRTGQHGIDDAAEHDVDPAFSKPRQQSRRHADASGDQHRNHAGEQACPRAEHHTR